MTTKLQAQHKSSDELTRIYKGAQIVATEAIKRNTPNSDFSIWTPVQIEAGEAVTVVSFTNAGFRGMEVAVRTAAGVFIPGLSVNLFA